MIKQIVFLIGIISNDIIIYPDYQSLTKENKNFENFESEYLKKKINLNYH